MQWLWYPYVPSSAATLLFGPGGGGKSHITVDIAARLTTGRPLPGQSEGGKPQKVLMLSAEDDFDVVLVPRLMNAGADLEKIGLPADPFTIDSRGLKMLEEYMHEFSATVVFIDPLIDYMGGKVDMFRANEVRTFMGPLHQMAMRKQTAVILVGHSRKSREAEGGEDYERIMGSADFSNAVRSVMFVTKASDGTKVMRHVKHNYSAAGETLAFEFGDGHFEWLGAIDEDGIVSDKPLKTMARRKAKSETWLRSVLAEGPIRAIDIPQLAKDAGFSMSTINRVKPAVAESFMRLVNGKPVWYWRLADEGDESDEIPIQGLEDLGDEPRGRVPGEAPKRRSSRRRVDAGEGTGIGDDVPSVGRRGQGARKGDTRARASEAPAPDPKAIAREFLRELGASR